MLDQSLESIIKTVSESENTSELSDYWKFRYEAIFQNNLFELSEKTQSLFSQDTVEKPATPFGDLILTNHLDKNGKLDQLQLQSTVDTAVRFLDSCLESLNFTNDAKNIVNQYRKIGLGIKDFSNYLEQTPTSSQIHEIDLLGDLISNASYRSSEGLVEEKGICTNWNNISQHLRMKTFEIWKHEKTGETKSGLDLSENFDAKTIKTSGFHIIPRRNSNILLFPLDLEWQIWSDRDETAPNTEITPFSINVAQDSPKTINTKKIEEPAIIKEILPVQKENVSNSEGPILEGFSEASLLDVNGLLSNEAMDLGEHLGAPIEEQKIPENENIKLQPLPLSASENNLPTNQNLNQTQKTFSQDPVSGFQVGELVELHSTNNPKREIHQVLEVIENKDGKKLYKLNDTEEHVAFKEEDLSEVVLEDLITKVNKGEENESKFYTDIYLWTLIFNDSKDQIFAENVDGKVFLPGTILTEAIEIEPFLIDEVKEKYNLAISFPDKTVVTTEYLTENGEFELHIGFTARAKNPDSSRYLSWMKYQDNEGFPDFAKDLISKIKEKDEIIQNQILELENKFEKDLQNTDDKKDLENKKQELEVLKEHLEEDYRKKERDLNKEIETRINSEVERRLALVSASSDSHPEMERRLTEEKRILHDEFEAKLEQQKVRLDRENLIKLESQERALKQELEAEINRRVQNELNTKSFGNYLQKEELKVDEVVEQKVAEKLLEKETVLNNEFETKVNLEVSKRISKEIERKIYLNELYTSESLLKLKEDLEEQFSVRVQRATEERLKSELSKPSLQAEIEKKASEKIDENLDTLILRKQVGFLQLMKKHQPKNKN